MPTNVKRLPARALPPDKLLRNTPDDVDRVPEFALSNRDTAPCRGNVREYEDNSEIRFGRDVDLSEYQTDDFWR